MSHRARSESRQRRPRVTIREAAAGIEGDIRELRHAIHREPEVGLDLPGTQRKVLEALDGLPLEITTGERLTSVTAVLRGGGPGGGGPGGGGPEGPTVLLRGDMDALPVRERTGLEYESRTDGAMHACGHDLHTAMLAGTARILSERRDELGGNVIFMFQPGEEGLGGARYMLDEGVLEAASPATRATPTAAYALHVFSDIAHGQFETRPGPILASSDSIDVTVKGRGGHASVPHRGADPVPAICEIVTALQTMVTRRFDVFDPVVLTVGSLHAGTARNVIPDQATFEGTARSFSEEARGRIEEESLRIVRDIARAHGLEADARFERRYPVTVNDAAEAAFATATARDLFGEGRAATRPYPMTGGEDFSYVLQRVPGAFVFLGACPPGTAPDGAPSNHSARAVFDDGVLADGAALYAELALRRLARP
ncbi:MAG: amidohydrolase [Nocardiopsaceae bacterium]|nr:amidohydrolase [Nocardiopsaceae bacterium]